MRKIYSIQKISYKINEKKIIKNITCDIEEGATIIRGPNGAGKTTLLKLIYGFIKPTSGVIKKHFDLSNKKVSFVFQDPVFLNRTVEDNLKHVLKCKSIDAKNWPYIISESIHQYSFKHLLKYNINSLSGGELQLLSLIRSTMLKPDILFYDEPTNNLDDKNIKLIKKLINNFHKEGRSIIIVSHNNFLIDDIAHRKLTIKDGAINYD